MGIKYFSSIKLSNSMLFNSQIFVERNAEKFLQFVVNIKQEGTFISNYLYLKHFR